MKHLKKLFQWKIIPGNYTFWNLDKITNFSNNPFFVSLFIFKISCDSVTNPARLSWLVKIQNHEDYYTLKNSTLYYLLNLR